MFLNNVTAYHDSLGFSNNVMNGIAKWNDTLTIDVVRYHIVIKEIVNVVEYLTMCGKLLLPEDTRFNKIHLITQNLA